MLNELGEPLIGHGVIKPISMEVMESQLEKRSQDSLNYNKRILKEFSVEQPIFYRICLDIAELYATEFANKHEIEGTQAYDDCFTYWTERLVFLLAFQYKLISLGVEEHYMNGDIRL